MTTRELHWEFFVNAYDVEPVISDIIAETYADEHPKRTAVLAYWIAGQMSCGAIDFAYDPGAGDEPAIDASEILDAFGRLFDTKGKWGWKTISCYSSTYDGEYDIQRLFVDDDIDGFTPPTDVKVLARRIADALVAAMDAGRISVDASEPYDSCRNCGGYHNVNYDCDSRDDD